uniref:Thioredoxin domain-containing protein n=1 Tax=Meloidogyne javanica TaxID=6303 RepID=A0A915MN03_MELJA
MGIGSSRKSAATYFINILFFVLLRTLNGKIASISYVPQGSNPLLYQPGIDHIVLLDQDTFSDTVFEPGRGHSFVVEFYADWCGHCRAFAPSFKQFAALTKRWSNVVKVGAVNCADSFNSQICRSNGVAYFPMLKYFSRKSKGVNDGMIFESAHSGTGISKFPYLALFKRGNQQSLFMDEFQGPKTLDDAMQRVEPGDFLSLDSEQQQSLQPTKPPVDLIDCERFPEKCKKLYYVSETDMLKAMRMALLDEVTRLGIPIEGDRFRKLYAFYFPMKVLNTESETIRRNKRMVGKDDPNILHNSRRAKWVIGDLQHLLEGKTSAVISVEEWRNHFERVEDPQFPKYQFPPLFLCPKCHAGGHFSRRQTRNFLLSYYGSVRPYHRAWNAGKQ